MNLRFETKEQLRHAYVIVSQDIEVAAAAAGEIAKAAVCKGGATYPCGRCSACLKVDMGAHPDVRTIVRIPDDKGKLRKDIIVDQVREVSADALVLPNESDHKVYIFKEGDRMNLSAQNAALKLLEEPPEGVILIICVTSAERLITTVRSRCALININTGKKTADSAQAETDKNEAESLAEEYLALAAERNPLELWKWCESNNGITPSEMTGFCGAVEKLVAATLRAADMPGGQGSNGGLTVEELLGITGLMGKCRERLAANTGVKHLFGMIGVATH